MKPKTHLVTSRRSAFDPALAGAILVTLTGTAAAIENLWLGETSDWNTATNWSLGRVPTLANGATTGDTFDDAVVNAVTPAIATITMPLAVIPRDIVVGSGVDFTGTVNHPAGTAATGPSNWMFVGRYGGTGTYNLADTKTVGTGVSGFAQGSGSLSPNGRLYVGGWAGAGTGTFNVNTTGTLAIADQLQVGHGSGTGVFNLENGTVTTATEWINLGNGAGSSGTFNMSGGTFTKGGANHFSIGANGGSGTGNISGGTLTVNNEIWLGQASGSLGTLNFSGGTIANNNYVAIGREGGTGNLNMTGGTWRKTGGGIFIVGASGPGSMIQSGGIVEVLAGDTVVGELANGSGTFTLSDAGEFRANYFQIARNAGSTGTVNLQGGTLKVAQIAGGNGAEHLYFDGTQIIATANQASFISGIDTDQAVINFGGLKINSNGLNIGVPQALNGFGGIVKSGAGTLTLTGANTFDGENSVTGGKLILNTASSGSGACTIANGAGLGVVQTAPTATLAIPSATFGSGGATTLDFDLGNLAGNPTAAPLDVTGTLALNGTVTINIADAYPAVGSIPLVSYKAPKTGGGSFSLGSLPAGTIATLSDNGAGLVSLDVTQVTMLVWKGVSTPGILTANWDINTSTNWADQLTGQAAKYIDLAAVRFDDNTISSGTHRITLTGTVVPSKVTINNTSNAYRFSGAGKITGTGALLKQGAGGLFLFNTTANEYTGPTILEGGTTSIVSLANGGVPSSIGASSASPANLVLAGGTLSFSPTPASTTIDRGFTISGTNSGISIGKDLTMGGQVVGLSGSLIKSGTGKLTLTHPGENGFGTVSPGLRVNQGSLVLIGSGTQTNTVGGDCWIGASPNLASQLVLTGTSLTVQSWLTIGRGNGNTGTVSSLTATDSTIASGNFSTGTIGTETLNNCAQTISLTNTNWTNQGATQLAESVGSATTMTVAGTSAFTTGYALRMAMATATSVNLTIQDSASVTKTGGWLAIGDGGTGVATVTVKNSGSLISTAGDFNIGDGGTAQGTLNLSDTATVSSTGIAFIGKGSGTKGTLNQTSGTFTGQSWIAIGRYTGAAGNSVGVVNVSGGTFNQTNPANSLIVGEDGTGTLTISGTGAVVCSGTVLISNTGTGIGTLNLNGGTLTTRQITAGTAGAGMGTFNFNGGMLIAGTGAIADFMNNLDAVTVHSPGARIDTNGQTVAINQALLDGGGNGGLTKLGAGFLQLNGACTFTGTTTVTAGSLGGTGSVAGPLVVNSGTTLAPGASVGTFAAGPTTLAGTYACEINGDAADKLVVNGSLAASAGSLVITELAAPTAAVYIIASYTGATPAPFASVTGLPTGYTLNYAYNDGSSSTNIALVGEDAYGMWAKTNITDINPSADATPSGDPDGDGAKNLTEFALNGNPLSAVTSGKVVGKIAKVAGSSTLVLTVPVRSAATFSGTTEQVSNSIDGVIYKIQASDTLATWDLAVSEVTGDDKTAIEASLPALGSGWTYRTFQSPGVVAGDPTDFMRAVIVKP